MAKDFEDRLGAIVEDLAADDVEKIILFGSAARGQVDRYSDVDIVVVKKTNRRFLERLVEAARSVRDELFPVDIFVYTPEEFEKMRQDQNPFIEQVLKEGKVVYEKAKRE